MLAKILMLLVFFGCMIAVGVYARKSTSSMTDFVLGGRSVGPWLTAFAYGTSYFKIQKTAVGMARLRFLQKLPMRPPKLAKKSQCLGQGAFQKRHKRQYDKHFRLCHWYDGHQFFGHEYVF